TEMSTSRRSVLVLRFQILVEWQCEAFMTNNFPAFALACFCKARRLFAIAVMAGLLTALSFHSVTASGLWPVSRLSLVSMNGKTHSGADAPSAMPAVS